MRGYQQLTRELMIFGCHVRVGISGDRLCGNPRHEPCPVLAGTVVGTGGFTALWLVRYRRYASYRTLRKYLGSIRSAAALRVKSRSGNLYRL